MNISFTFTLNYIFIFEMRCGIFSTFSRLKFKNIIVRSNYSGFIGLVIMFIFIIISTPSCKTKEGCGLEEKLAPNMESKGGKSGLFSKKQTKRMSVKKK